MRSILRARATHLALAFALASLVYANAIPAPFVHDDWGCIVHNPAVADVGLLADTDRLDDLALPSDLRNNIKTRPFAYLTFAANRLLSGVEPAGFRRVNVVIHAINSCLVYLLAGALLARARRREGGEDDAQSAPPDARWLALVAALLFAVHPVGTNAVTYITQRFASLATLLYLLALLAYVAARSAASAGRAVAAFLVSLAATVLAMRTKEIAFTIPVAMTLVEAMFLAGPRARRALTLAPFYATMLILPLTLWSLAGSATTVGGRLLGATDLMNLDGIPRSAYLFTQLRVIVTYLRILLLPVGLNFDHDFPISHSFTEPRVLVSFALLVLFLAVGFYFLARSRDVTDPRAASFRLGAFGVFWFFLTLSMTSSIIPINDVINEYRVYLPSVGFHLFAVGAGHALVRSWPPARARVLARVGVAVAAAVVCALAVATVRRNAVWSDSLAFWKDTGGKSPGKVRPALTLSEEYLRRDRPEEAIETLETLVRLNPGLGRPHFFLGSMYVRLGRHADAVAEFLRAKAVRDDKAEIYVGLTRAYLGLGDKLLAAEALEVASRLEPANPELPRLRDALTHRQD